MAKLTDAQLATNSLVVKNETVSKANTATRVGTLFEDFKDSKANKDDALGVVVHGATAGTARPTNYDVVMWIGSVEPTNAINDDIWQSTV